VVYASPEVNPGSYSQTHAQLLQTWREVVAEDVKTCLFDAAARFTAPAVDNTDGYYFDLLHPSDKGHSALADRMAAFLSPA